MISQLRKFENLHIVFWLLKDTCWLLQLKIFGSAMIAPTLLLAYYITIISRKARLHLFPNMAVSCWITANSLWMLWEFFDFPLKYAALTFFGAGLLFITLHYIYIFSLIRKKQYLSTD
jgi:hypothetical protein